MSAKNAESARPPYPPKHDGRILIVDDQASIIDTLSELLQREFSQVRGTTRPREVEGLLASYRPDLLLLDLNMPEMDGFEILDLINRTQPADVFLPVIILTATHNEAARWKALEMGAIDYLTKPFRFEEVLLRTRNHLQTRRLHLQLEKQNRALDNVLTERSAELQWTEIQLRASEDKLLKQVRFNAMGTMAAGVAHDFNNSVAIIKGHSEMMVAYPDLLRDPEQVAHAFSVINKAADDATSVVRRLREFYRPQEDWEENGSIDLRSACKDIIPLTQPKWQSQAQADGRQIKVTSDLESVPVAMPSAKVREILTNLIFNAVDAMPEGGTIHLSSRREGNSGIVEVSDTGTGMTEEVRRRCLEPFYSTKGEHGTGLGLGTVAGLVKRFHGQIEIQSSPGQGTTFRITLPEELEMSPSWDQEDDHRLDRRLHVLLVDDEENVRAVIEAALLRDGHTVVPAADGREAMALFHGDYFDLIITDCAMPHINGIQLAAAIRRHAPNKPILMLTGFMDQMLTADGATGAISQIINKPVGLASLRQALFELFPPREKRSGLQPGKSASQNRLQ